MARPEALLFDFNGTISDDEPLVCQIFVELCADRVRPGGGPPHRRRRRHAPAAAPRRSRRDRRRARFATDQEAARMTPLVIAHRGACLDEPENTLAAFQRAIELGADYVELDVHAARDGRLVVVHDRPDGAAALPTLEEVLEALRGRVGVMLDLKRPYCYRRHDLLR